MPNVFKTYPMNGIKTIATTIHTATLKSVIIGLDICNVGGAGGALDLNIVRDSRTVDAAWTDDNGSFSTKTSDAASSSGSTFSPFPDPPVANQDRFLVGSLGKFSSVDFDITTSGSGTSPTITWEYWNGSTWSALTVGTDGTSDFTAATGVRNLSFTVPTDWEKQKIDTDPIDLYYIRGEFTSGDYNTQDPVLESALPKGLTMEFLKGTPLPVGSTLQAISGQKTVLEANDSINLATSTSEVSAILTVLEDVN